MFSITGLNIQWGTQDAPGAEMAYSGSIAHSAQERAHSAAQDGRCVRRPRLGAWTAPSAGSAPRTYLNNS